MARITRRSFASLIPAVPIAVPGMIRELAAFKRSPKTFQDISALFIHSDTDFIHTSGYLTPGDRGHATYVSDHLATPELAKLTPNFCTVGADGRCWRAAVYLNELVPVAAGGAVGSISGQPNHSTNDQPAIAQALVYQGIVGASGLTFNNGDYSIWCPLRTAIDDNINYDKTGIPFLIDRPTVLQSGNIQTTFRRRKFDGSDPAIFPGTQYLPHNWVNNGYGIYWRGGMFLIVGKSFPRPAYSELASLHIKGNWNIDGGIPQSPNCPGLKEPAGTPPWYSLYPDGSGWDITDKPIWLEQDRNTGDIIYDGNVTIGRFRGELLYQAGAGSGSVYQVGSLTLHDTDANGFNPNVCFSNGTSDGYGTVQMESLNIYSAYQALEGSAGWHSYIRNLSIKNCVLANGLMAGVWNIISQPQDRPAPIFTINNLTVKSSSSFVSMSGNSIICATLFDTSFWIGRFDINTHDSVAQQITIIADKSNLQDGVLFFSATTIAGERNFYNNSIISVTMSQSEFAHKNGNCVINPVNWYSYLADGNIIEHIQGFSRTAPHSRAALAPPVAPTIIKNDLRYI